MGASLAVTRTLLVYIFSTRPSVVLMKCQDYTYIQKKKILTVFSRGHQCGFSLKGFIYYYLHEVNFCKVSIPLISTLDNVSE